MPLASSTDLVMAGIQDIIQALQNPTANSPLAPRTDSQVQALQDLTSLLTGIIKQDSHDAPSLRVDAPATLNETATTKQSSIMKTSADNAAPTLRVEFKEPLTEPTVPPHQVQADEPATYENSTGAKGQRRRKQAHKAKKDKNMPPTASTHMHGTRANVKNTNKEHSQQPTLPCKLTLRYTMLPYTATPSTQTLEEPVSTTLSSANGVMAITGLMPVPMRLAACAVGVVQTAL
jgi:hypothetical protein